MDLFVNSSSIRTVFDHLLAALPEGSPLADDLRKRDAKGWQEHGRPYLVGAHANAELELYEELLDGLVYATDALEIARALGRPTLAIRIVRGTLLRLAEFVKARTS